MWDFLLAGDFLSIICFSRFLPHDIPMILTHRVTELVGKKTKPLRLGVRTPKTIIS